MFQNKEPVENALKFPRAIAVGHVYTEAGLAEINMTIGHVCWWLYDEVEIDGFSICESTRGDDNDGTSISVFFVCKNKNVYFIALNIDLDEERYILMRISLNRLSKMLHGKITMRELILIRILI